MDIEHTASTLGVSRVDAAKLLSRWASQGWLRRVGSGTYVPVQLESLASEHVLDDPWILVPSLFAPGYIGGRTAAHHWDLTEQLFRDIVVLTTQIVRQKRQLRHGAEFTLTHIQKDKVFGTKTVWRRQTKVMVSDVHRTIIDMLDDPALGSGIQFVSDCFHAYLRRPDRNDTRLIEYATHLRNGAVFKRLGFLAEREPGTESLVASCEKRITKGTTALDPALPAQRLVTRWRLWIPNTWAQREHRD